jgi:enoyl-CoA hydratase/carnithine racemase
METTYIDEIIAETIASKEIVKLFENNNIFYVVMNNGDNKYSWNFTKKMFDLYDDVLGRGDDLTNWALVTLSTHPKIWSNGLDLPSFKDPEDLGEYLKYCAKQFVKLVACPIPTIALLNGHWYAAGLTAAFCHDFIVMRSDRGYLSFNEMLFGAPVPKWMAVVMKNKIGTQNYADLFLNAPKLTAKDALERKLIHIAAPQSELYQRAMEFAEEKCETCVDPMACKISKEDIYSESIEELSNAGGIHPYASKKLYEYKDILAKL